MTGSSRDRLWRACGALLSGGALAGAGAGGPDATVRGLEPTANVTVRSYLVREALLAAASRRMDVVMIGDSNQTYNSAGWHDGWTVALGERWPMYATPILGSADNNAIGIAMNTQPLAPGTYLLTSAPPELEAYCDPDSGVNLASYAYLDANRTVLPGTPGGMELDVASLRWWQNNFNHFGAMRWWYTYGTFGEARGGRFQAQVKQAGTFDVSGPAIDPATGSWGLQDAFVDVPAGPRNANDIVFKWFSGKGLSGHGPFFGLYMRVERPEASFGFSPHTLYGTGGASSRACLLALEAASDAHLIGFFARVRALQPEEKVVLIRIALGGNDFLDENPSVGPVGGFPSDTPEGVRDNMLGILARLRSVWSAAGWPEDEVVFLLVGNHTKMNEPAEFGFRQTLAEIALEDPRVAFVNLGALADEAEMSANGWYDAGGGAHLTRAGYEALSRREVVELLVLPGDINRDNVVDTSDLALLLEAIGRGTGPEDLNSDGIVDTADLGLLLNWFGSVGS